MRTYRDGDSLRNAVIKAGNRSVWVEFDVDLAAALLGQDFIGPQGPVRVEKVRLYRAENGVLAAQPLVVRRPE